MIEIQHDSLVISFPEVHRNASARIGFQRTLRIPDDGHEYPLPPGLGNFPLLHVDDYANEVPKHWLDHGGVFLPMYQSEAMWINFDGHYPMAIKIAAGKINAVSGSTWSNALTHSTRQDYVVVPEQPWLDGFNIDADQIRQFVATPLLSGHTVEEQLTGEAEVGGVQIIVFPMKRERYLKLRRTSAPTPMSQVEAYVGKYNDPEMGLGAGGLMKQRIYEDPYRIDAWDLESSSRCFVHIANSQQFYDITETMPPNAPPSAEDYNELGLPWFEVYDDHLDKLEGGEQFQDLSTVPETPIKSFEPEKPPRRITPGNTFKIRL